MPENVIPPEAPGPAEPEQKAPPAGEARGRPAASERTLAIIAWVLAISTSFVGPLVLYVMKKDDSKFVAFHALQAVIFAAVASVTFLVVLGLGGAIAAMAGLPALFAVSLMPAKLIWLAAVVVDTLWCIKAHDGEWAELPVIGGWAKG